MMNKLKSWWHRWICSPIIYDSEHKPIEDSALKKLRLKHIKKGHPLSNGTRIDKLRSENHPHTDSEFIYTINIYTCNECGLTYNDCGLEYRKRPI